MHPCPNCGYCPCCGRVARPLFIEWSYYPQYPWWPVPSGQLTSGHPTGVYTYRFIHGLDGNAVTITAGSN